MCIVFVLDGIFRPESTNGQYMYIVFVLDGIFRPESSGRNINTRHLTQQQWMCIVFVLDLIFRPEYSGRKKLTTDTTAMNAYCVLYLYWTEYSGRKVEWTINVYCICIGRNIPAGKWEWKINVYCICIGRNIPAGKWIQHKHNNNKCVLYLYWTEYSGRKVRVNNKCVLYLYWTEYSGRKVRVNNKCVLYLYWTDYSGRKVNTTQTQQLSMCIVFVLDGIFRPESEYNTNTTTINVYCIRIWRNIPAGKWEWTINLSVDLGRPRCVCGPGQVSICLVDRVIVFR